MSTPQQIVIDDPREGLEAVCEPILRGLPLWFGIEEAIVTYVRELETLPTFLARDQGRPIGFLSVKRHYVQAAEMHLIAVEADYHRSGTGRALLEAAKCWLARDGVKYLQVKTLSPSREDPNYARTRFFYEGVGFAPLEEFPTLWGEHNPCLQLIMTLP